MSGIPEWAEVDDARSRLLAVLEIERATGCPEIRMVREDTDAVRAERCRILEVETLAYDTAHQVGRVALRAVS